MSGIQSSEGEGGLAGTAESRWHIEARGLTEPESCCREPKFREEYRRIAEKEEDSVCEESRQTLRSMSRAI